MASTFAESSNKPTLAPSPFVLPADLPPLPEVAGTDPTRCVLDSFRVAIAKAISDALEPLTVEQVYQGVDYGKKGEDFTVALPRFKLKGKVDELAKTVIEKVRLYTRDSLLLGLSGVTGSSMGGIAPAPYPISGLGSMSLICCVQSFRCADTL